MNAKQAAREAAKRIAELEDFNRRASGEIKALNACIDSVIAGEKTYCDWCEDREECQLKAKETGSGCSEWWMSMQPQDRPELADYLTKGGAEPDESAGILSASPNC